MALQIDEYALGPRNDPDFLIFFPYPWGGDRHNNKQLLKEVALLTGGLVIGAQTPGTGRLFVRPSVRQRLRPERFAGLAADYAGEVREFLESRGQPVRLLSAQSGRVALGASMQLSEHRPFTHALLRDGVNLHAPERFMDGMRRLGAQPAKGEYAQYEERRSLLHKAQDVRSWLHSRMEAVNHGPLLVTTASRDAVAALTRDPTTPLAHITMERGITGTTEQQIHFNKTLEQQRALAAAVLAENEAAQPLHAGVATGNHADLLNPLLLAYHVRYALALTGFVCRAPQR